MTTKNENKALLADDVRMIRKRLLAKATGNKPTYSTRVEFGKTEGADSENIHGAMATHTVYSRTGY